MDDVQNSQNTSPVRKTALENLGGSLKAKSGEVVKTDEVPSNERPDIDGAKRNKPVDHSKQPESIFGVKEKELKSTPKYSVLDLTDTAVENEEQSAKKSKQNLKRPLEIQNDEVDDESEKSQKDAAKRSKPGNRFEHREYIVTAIMEALNCPMNYSELDNSVEETAGSLSTVNKDNNHKSQEGHLSNRMNRTFDDGEVKYEHNQTEDKSHPLQEGDSGSIFQFEQSSYGKEKPQEDYSYISTPHTKRSYSYDDQPRSRDHFTYSYQKWECLAGYRNQFRSQFRNPEYLYWNSMVRGMESEDTNVTERFGDLFSAPNEYALVHCVAEDMHMSSGITRQFRIIFERVDELLQQHVTQGGVAVLHVNNRYIYYLVTKRRFTGKPTYETLFRSLLKMREHVIENKVTKIALPRIGCGRDGLNWVHVKSMLRYIFHGVNTKLVVYNFQLPHWMHYEPPH